MVGNKQIGVLILAGGASRRMGENKAFLPIEQTTLLERLLHQFDHYPVYLSVRDKTLYQHLGAMCVLDEREDAIGPMGGIYAGLCQCNCDYLWVVPCDMPEIKENDFIPLMDVMGSQTVGCCYEGVFLYPTLAIYTKRCIPYLERLMESKHYALKGMLSHKGFQTVPVPGDREKAFLNINTKKEYQDYKKAMESEKDRP